MGTLRVAAPPVSQATRPLIHLSCQEELAEKSTFARKPKFPLLELPLLRRHASRSMKQSVHNCCPRLAVLLGSPVPKLLQACAEHNLYQEPNTLFVGSPGYSIARDIHGE